MELRQLRYFVAVAEERHFGRAAQRLKISTPTLSQQLRVLERSLGVMLVDRSRPGVVTLTPGGEVMMRHARALLIRAERARDEVRVAAGQPEQILLRVAPGAEVLLAPQLQRLTDDAALGVITMASSTSDSLMAVRAESGDAAIVWDGKGDGQGLTTVVLRDVTVHLALPTGHRLAQSARVDVSDLADEPIVMFPRPLSPHSWDTMQRHLLPDGMGTPDQIITESNATGRLSVPGGVAGGRGVAPVIAALAEQDRHVGVVLRPLEPPLTLPLELAWREPSGGALQRVVAILRSECRTNAALDHELGS